MHETFAGVQGLSSKHINKLKISIELILKAKSIIDRNFCVFINNCHKRKTC